MLRKLLTRKILMHLKIDRDVANGELINLNKTIKYDKKGSPKMPKNKAALSKIGKAYEKSGYIIALNHAIDKLES